MGMQSVLYLDDFDTATLGVVVEKVTGISDVPEVTPRTRERYARAGVLEVAAFRSLAPRKITVTGAIGAATVAALETALDTFKAKLVPSTVRARFANLATREWTVVPTGFVVTPFPGPGFLHVYRQFTLDLLALDPYGYDISDTVVGSIVNADSACAVGTAPSRPVLRCTGAAMNPLWTYKSQAGTTIQTLQLTITVAGGDWVEVDCATSTIRKSVSSVITDAITTLTSGDFIVLDPRDKTTTSPTLRVSDGTGTATYRKAWL
jgi:uncharacterized protein (DUF697 family)